MNKSKKQKAAIIGVINYLKEEQAILSAQNAAIQEPRQIGSWTQYGRQMTMLNRDRMQRRVIKR